MRNFIDDYIDRRHEETRKKYETIIADKDHALAESNRALADKDRALAESNRALADKDRALAEMAQELRELKLRLGIA